MSARAPSLINSPPLLLVKVGLLALSPCPLASAMLAPVLGSPARLAFLPPSSLSAADGRVEMLSRVRGFVRVGASEGGCYLEGDGTGWRAGRETLRGRKGRIWGQSTEKGGRGSRGWARNAGEKARRVRERGRRREEERRTEETGRFVEG